jgi:hypothetical protein
MTDNERFYRNAMRYLEARSLDDPALCKAVRRYVNELRREVGDARATLPPERAPEERDA